MAPLCYTLRRNRPSTMPRAEALVKVLNSDLEFVEDVSPAVARSALSEGAAKVYSTDPFSIVLESHLKRCPVLFGRWRNQKMLNTNKLNELLREEQPIYARALVPGQVLLTFVLDPVTKMTEKVLVRAGEVVCITDRIPWDVIKSNNDLRAQSRPRPLANRSKPGMRPPSIEILSQDDYDVWLSNRAIDRGFVTSTGKPDVNAMLQSEMEENSGDSMNLASKLKEAESEDAPKADPEDTAPKMYSVSGINHRVEQLVYELGQSERPTASAILNELDMIESTLKAEDLEHLIRHGYYKTVQKWAERRLANLEK